MFLTHTHACTLHTRVHSPCSRVQVYVQDRLREDGARVWRHLSGGGAHVYVCGGTAMGADVQAAFADIAANHGALDADDARAFMQRLHAEGRYVQELWS
jgi:sulfite reductase alpha subunit-like flavoprotein